MFLHVKHPGEVLSTVVAGIWSLSSVDPLVLNQVAFGSVRFDATLVRTNERSFGLARGGKEASEIRAEVFLVSNQLQLSRFVFIIGTNQLATRN